MEGMKMKVNNRRCGATLYSLNHEPRRCRQSQDLVETTGYCKLHQAALEEHHLVLMREVWYAFAGRSPAERERIHHLVLNRHMTPHSIDVQVMRWRKKAGLSVSVNGCSLCLLGTYGERHAAGQCKHQRKNQTRVEVPRPKPKVPQMPNSDARKVFNHFGDREFKTLDATKHLGGYKHAGALMAHLRKAGLVQYWLCDNGHHYIHRFNRR